MKNNKTVTKADLIEAVFEKIGYTKKLSGELVEGIFDLIKDQLLNGRGVKIYGFGKFVLKDKKARRGRDPQTGKSITIEPRRVLVFRPSLILRGKIKD